MDLTITVFAVSIFLTAWVGGVLPIVTTWSDRALHLFVALATGIFLGAVFLHLLPELAESSTGTVTWLVVLSSLVAIYTLEVAVLPKQAARLNDSHLILGYISFAGLSIHSLTAGFGLAVAFHRPGVETAIFLSIIAHKAAAAFSLSSVFALAQLSGRRVARWLLAFSLMTPLGLLGGRAILAGVRGINLTIPTAIAAGTFLYVALCDLLPEVFHHRQDQATKLGLLMLGVLITLALKAAH